MASTVWAARYSQDIEGDIAQGYSYAGWAIDAAASEEQLRSDLVNWYGWSERNAENIDVAYSEQAGGYLPIHAGLCAFTADERQDAIDAALADSRWGEDVPLYVFEAVEVETDPEDGTSIVRPVSAPERVR